VEHTSGTTDAELFGRATLWALDEEKARNEIFNVSNGDVYRWRQLWNELAAFYESSRRRAAGHVDCVGDG